MDGRIVSRTSIIQSQSRSQRHPASLLGASHVETVDNEAKVILSRIANIIVRASLEGFFNFNIGVREEVYCTVDSTVIKTYRMQNQFDAFEKMVETPRVYDALTGPKGLSARNDYTSLSAPIPVWMASQILQQESRTNLKRASQWSSGGYWNTLESQCWRKR